MIGYVMLVVYHPIVEALGFVILLAAVGLDLYLVYRAECLPRHIGEHRPSKAAAVAQEPVT